jgi:hypothetical protein
MAGLLDEPYIGYPQLRRRSEQSLLGGTPRGLLNTTPSADTLRKLGEQLINIPTSATRAITDPQLFSRLLGITPNQQLSGFSAGYAGVPAKPPSDIGVVDPRNIDYSKGYSSGEEMGMMTALAAPLAPLARPVGRAVGEQAYRMTEDMLQSQGLMPSITAYHGTPYNIQGKFDINKVGTGEGAQAYGHGMYYAENPSVASGYAKTLGQRKAGYEIDGVRITPKRGSIEDMAVNLATGASGVNAKNPFEYAKNRALELVKQNPQMQEVAKKIEELQSLGANLKTSGNLYKVDIPDQYVPNMLDWDKPLNQQTKEVQEGLAKLGIKTDTKKLNEFDDALLSALKGDANNPLPKQPINPTGEDIYKTFVQGNPQLTSQKLNEVGIKGIRYADEGSRNWRILTPDESVSGKWTVGKWPGGGKEQKYFDNEKDAKEYFNQNYTSNFVVFEPKDVKILEKNSQKVESLLD